MAVAIIIGAQMSSRILTKVGVRPLLFTGSAIATLGFFWVSLIKTHSTYWGAIFTPSVLCAFALGLLFAPLATAATAGVDRADAGLASGVLNTSRQVGGSLALAILGTVAADRTASFVDPQSMAALVSGYQRAFQVSAVIAALAFALSIVVPRRLGHSSH
jgi:MFS family permease